MNVTRKSLWSAVVAGSLAYYGLGAHRAHAATATLAPVADTTLWQAQPTNNLGGQSFFIAGTTFSTGQKSRALLKFDIAGNLPPGSTIVSASLHLVVTANGPGAVSGQVFGLHRVLKDWGEGSKSGGGSGTGVQGAPATEGEATWNARFHPSTLWTAAGALAGTDYTSAASASQGVNLAGSTNSFSSTNLAADVQQWLSNPGTNFGWILIVSNETVSGSARHFGSREALGNAPVLVVEYAAAPTPPVITNTTLVGNAIQFQFTAEAGQTYTVEFRGALNGGSPSTLTNIPAQPSATTITITDPLTPSNRFYQIRTP